jgi:hypothetical protein
MLQRLMFWVAILGLAACSHTQTQDLKGPPLVGGVYIYPSCEGEGGCPNLNWRTIEPTPLLKEQKLSSQVIATLQPQEWVSVVLVETRLVPLKGVVRADSKELRKGDTIYQLEYEGEGYSNYWYGGAFQSLSDDAQIDFEPQTLAPELDASLGLWAKLKRQNGQTGWVYKPSFECMGKLAGDEGCRE